MTTSENPTDSGQDQSELAKTRAREAAIRDILDVVSRSRDDEGPVFETILDNAQLLCDAQMAGLVLGTPEDKFQRMVAHRNIKPETVERFETGGMPMDGETSYAARSIVEGRLIHLPDMKDSDLYRADSPVVRFMVDDIGIRSVLFVPLMLGNVAIGTITLFRYQVAPFSDSQVALIETFAAQAVIAIENVRQFREIQERLEREQASAEVLEVISRSRDDEYPVFDTVLRNAAILCDAETCALLLGRPDQTELRMATYHAGDREQSAEEIADLDKVRRSVMEMDPEQHIAAQAICSGEVVHVPDLTRHPRYLAGAPGIVTMVDIQHERTILSVPLVGPDGVVGAINLHRKRAEPFSHDQIELVKNFAAQAVIAIENVRQFREVQERLEREAATSEILGVISQSRDDEVPVFDAILKNAQDLCNAPMSALVLATAEDTYQTLAAQRGLPEKAAEMYLARQVPVDSSLSYTARAIVEAKPIAFAELCKSDLYASDSPGMRSLVDVSGVGSVLFVPLIRNDAAIGSIALFRQEVEPFDETEIALIETFAAQAVIAIENVRQFREVQERLAREQASREVLGVISQSRDDETPVFDNILKNAARLSGAPQANLCILSDDRSQWQLVAHFGDGLRHLTTGKNTNLMDSNLVPAQSMRTGQVIHIENLTETDLYRQGDPGRVAMVEAEGMRTIVGVPLLKEGAAIGCITLFRREVKAFTEDEIALVETFAAQAVIAIENVRQFRELQERLERETATGQVLQVISHSRDDDLPVFDIILENAARLCGADRARLMLANDDRTQLRAAGQWGEPNPAMPDGMEIDMVPEMAPVRSMLEKRVVNVKDGRETEGYKQGVPQIVANIDAMQARSVLAVPLIREDEAIGCIVLTDGEVAAYDDNDATLVQTFAAQAVIAIENVRQFREVQERLERETATGEVLGVISRSRNDDRPVFDVILENAARLCNASNANLTLLNDAGDAVRLVASHGRPILSLVVGESEWKLDEATTVAEALTEGQPIHIPDFAATQSYRDGSSKLRVRLVDEDGIRSSLAVPLIGADGPIGTLMLHRDEPGAFSEAEISLVMSFAAQAVIAIENVKTFKALEALNAELGDRVEEQVGEIERMGRLKRFLSPQVADAVVMAGDEKLLTSHRALIAILFCDIRGFTAFCESAEPEETIEVLQTFHETMGELIHKAGAGFDHRAGDGIMVVFNDPIPCDDPAGDALRTAVLMRDCMQGLCAQWRKLGHRLGFGVGISLGYATVGMVGFEGRYDYTASGSAVNLGSRLCDHAADGEILLSPRATIAVEDIATVEHAGDLTLKGFHAPVEVSRVTGMKETT